jgi:hypothetical protein
MQSQLQQLTGQIQSQLTQLQGQIQLQSEQIRAQTEIQRIQTQSETAKMKEEINLQKIDNEKQVEMAYLNFAYTELEVNATNQRAQMLINRAKTTLDIKKSQKKERVKD